MKYVIRPSRHLLNRAVQSNAADLIKIAMINRNRQEFRFQLDLVEHLLAHPLRRTAGCACV
ncbi:MAG: hypothetical protein ACREO9_09710, partial [Lysobacterales bacterium]